MTPQDGGMPMTTRIRRAENLAEPWIGGLIAATGCGKA
jgi:hypothetical protein